MRHCTLDLDKRLLSFIDCCGLKDEFFQRNSKRANSKTHTGVHDAVQHYMYRGGSARILQDRAVDDGLHYGAIAVACARGRHRSVAIAARAAVMCSCQASSTWAFRRHTTLDT